MASASVPGGGGSGKKSLNAELNLVPYIDLLTCMVSFLLITAVWTQLARMSVQQKGQGAAGEETPPDKVTKVVIVVNDSGFNLVEDQDQQVIAKKGDSYDYEKLSIELKKVKERHPDKNDVQIAAEDQIKFDVLVQAMDTVLANRFPDVSLIDAGGAGI